MQPAAKEGPRINEEIRVREVQLIDKDGANKGVTEINAAIAMAQEAGLDLVEIAPNSVPPVCKILDFGDALVGAVFVDELDLAYADLLVDARTLLGGGLRRSAGATNGF